MSLSSPLMLKLAKNTLDNADILPFDGIEWPFLTEEAMVFSIQDPFTSDSHTISTASALDDVCLDEWLAFDTDSSQCDPESDSASIPVSQTSPTQTENPVTPERVTSPPSSAVRRSGRLSKKESQSRGARVNAGRLGLKVIRKTNDNFGLRSRPRLHRRLDDLWKVIPKEEKELQMGPGSSIDGNVLCRADRVVVAIAYIRKLQKRPAELTDGRMGPE